MTPLMVLTNRSQSVNQRSVSDNVYPLDDRLYDRFNAAIAGRPDLMGDRKSLTLAEGMDGILENTFLNVKNRNKEIVANVSLKGNDKGIILCQGRHCGHSRTAVSRGVLVVYEGQPTRVGHRIGESAKGEFRLLDVF